ncbi:MAG: AAC(3) family N-acetyltransferase [Candidatus Coatesbacteria bacterium]
MIGETEIRDGLVRAGLEGVPAEVHSSLRSFGRVDGGADTVVAALTKTAALIAVPTFCWDASVRHATRDHVEHNAAEEPDPLDPGHPIPFDPATSRIDDDMGRIAKTVAGWPGARRSGHPLVSWAAWGAGAEAVVRDHGWDDAFRPIKRVVDLNGSILLLGVTLTSCTAVHLAEEMAGRRSFIRWAQGADGVVRRARTGGCSEGFDNLLPHLRDVIRETTIGSARVIIAPLAPFLGRVAAIIRRTPEITMCRARCDRCRAAVAGGPAA